MPLGTFGYLQWLLCQDTQHHDDKHVLQLMQCLLQAESIMLAFHTIFASLNALWFSNSDSCWSYVVSWLVAAPSLLHTPSLLTY